MSVEVATSKILFSSSRHVLDTVVGKAVISLLFLVFLWIPRLDACLACYDSPPITPLSRFLLRLSHILTYP
jgi:hypothetical protein